MEKIKTGLHHTCPQQHMLVTPYQTMTEAVKIANEFLELETKASVNAVETQDKPEPTATAAGQNLYDLQGY